MNRICLACLLPVLAGVVLRADDWPQWQGPQRNAISAEVGLLQQWPEAGPPLAWRVDGLGGGDSSPAVVDGTIYGMSNRDGREIVWAISERDGTDLWISPLGDAVEQRMPQSREGPGCTPSVDGDRLYVIGMAGTVACLNTRDGKIIWRRSLTEDFGGVVPTWSYRESPLVDGDKVICTPGSSGAVIVALNKHNGETIWQARMPGTAERPSGEGDARVANRRSQSQNRGERRGQSETANGPGGNGSTPRVTGTEDPGLFLSEHWGMTAFTRKLPSGNYLAKLYFAETYSGIRGEGQRVFSFNVQGTDFKDFDIWKKAGGFQKAYVESVPVQVTDGEFRITFTRQAENPAIKAIEIIPQGDTKGEAIRIKAGQTTPFTDSKGQVWLADQGFTGGATSPGFFNFGGGRAGGSGRAGRFRGGRGGARSGAAYSSVIAIDFEGQRQYVQLTANALVGVAASNGHVLWQYSAPANAMGINCSTPIFQDGLLFAASAYGTGGGAVKLVKQADGAIEAEEVYFTNRMQNHHGGMIVVDGCLYGANGGNGGGILACLDFQTGDVLWRDRKGPKGALLLADNRIYLRGEEGEVVLIEPSRDGLVERGRFDQPDRSGSPAWAHPIVANGKLYIRDQGLLLCYDIAE